MRVAGAGGCVADYPRTGGAVLHRAAVGSVGAEDLGDAALRGVGNSETRGNDTRVNPIRTVIETDRQISFR